MADEKVKAEETQPSVESRGKKLIAKKDWRILCGSWDKAKNTHEFDFQVKTGDDVGKLNLPKWALVALKTENVI